MILVLVEMVPAAVFLFAIASGTPAWFRTGHFHAMLSGLLLMRIGVQVISDEALGSRSATYYAIVCLAAGMTAGCASRSLRRPPLSVLVAATALILLAFRTNPDSTLRLSALTFVLPAFLLGITHSVSVVSLKRTIFAIAILSVPSVFLLGVVTADRLSIGAENPIWVARLFVLGAVAAIHLKVTFIGRIVLVAGFMTLAYETESRGPVWALVTVLVVLVVDTLPRRHRPFAWITLAVSIVLASVVLNLETVSNLGLSRQQSPSFRLELLHRAFSQWVTNPLFGSGIPSDDPASGLAGYPHNFLAETLAQAGVVGLLCLLVIIAVAITRAEDPFVRSLIIASIVFSLLSGSLWTNYELWISCAVAIGISVRLREEPSRTLRSMKGRNELWLTR